MLEPAKVDDVVKLDDDMQTLLRGNVDLDEGTYARVGTIGDGSCFFHSVCYAINKDGYIRLNQTEKKLIAHKYRQKFAAQSNKDNMLESLCARRNVCPKQEDLSRKLMDPKTWADQEMIMWASEVLGKNIVFVDDNKRGPQMYCGVHNDGDTIIILWIKKSHFELVAKVHDIGEQNFTLQTIFNRPGVMDSYRAQCGAIHN
tara:strand:- start:6299 stop:6901 length:603 start_codon:yes stop_codon:yes gene_type:complete